MTKMSLISWHIEQANTFEIISHCHQALTHQTCSLCTFELSSTFQFSQFDQQKHFNYSILQSGRWIIFIHMYTMYTYIGCTKQWPLFPSFTILLSRPFFFFFLFRFFHFLIQLLFFSLNFFSLMPFFSETATRYDFVGHISLCYVSPPSIPQ